LWKRWSIRSLSLNQFFSEDITKYAEKGGDYTENVILDVTVLFNKKLIADTF
jgi:hypothetical protein